LSQDRDRVIGVLGPIVPGHFSDFLSSKTLSSPMPPGQGGISVNTLCHELLQRGHRLKIFSLDPTIKQAWSGHGEQLDIFIGPKARRAGYRYFGEERRFLVQAVQREKPDILHAHWTYEYALAASASGLPHVVTARDAPWQILNLHRDIYRLIRMVMAYHACHKAQRIVAVSPHISQHLHHYRLHRKPITVIPNAVSPRLFELPRQATTRDHVVFATLLSGWSTLKNGSRAIAAFAKLRERHTNTRLIMFGDGYGPGQSAEHWARANNIDTGITFIGQTPHNELLSLVAREADIILHPALEESFGLPLIEAGALGLPIIAGRESGGVPWVLGDGAWGVLVDVRSVDAIADSMDRLATDLQGRLTTGAIAREQVRNRFHISRIADLYEKVYEEIEQT
jgi:glycosyltransferase involved in cell wall biosynthesis